LPPSNVPRNAAVRVSRRVPRSTGRKRPENKPLSWKPRLAIAAVAAALVLLIWAAIARGLAPTSNTSLTRFDAIVVLGTPADSDGNPTPEQLARVTEAVHEYQRGIAPRLILTGGATRHSFVEARVMAHTAEAQGIPKSAIFMEPDAKDTIQNACYSARIMKAHGWHSAEIVATAPQLPRASLIFNALPPESLSLQSLEWSAHTAPPLSPASSAYEGALTAVEVLKTARYLIWARWADRCEP
jgi:uncharacterized SAM-binding protein YcdF (DUF218 family)